MSILPRSILYNSSEGRIPFEQIGKAVSFKSVHFFYVSMGRREMKSHRIQLPVIQKS